MKLNQCDIYEKLNNAWNASTQECNRFLQAIRSIQWDGSYMADGDYVFYIGDFEVQTPVLDPFEKSNHLPSVWWADGSGYIELGYNGESHSFKR